jgi:stage III sporulation protein AG
MDKPPQRENKLNALIKKIRGIKHIEIIIGIIAVALMLLVFSSGIFRSGGKERESAPQTAATVTATWETRLGEIISGIQGVGRAEVMITFASTPQKLVAGTVTTTTSSSEMQGGGRTTSSSSTEAPVIVNNNGVSQPYILKETMPDVIGVVVVAQGAESPIIRLAIMRAVQTALSVPANKVEIFAMN